MPAKMGSRRSFDSGVVAAIIAGKSANRLDNKRSVNRGDLAEVNEHLFPRSGKCFGLLVEGIATSKSRPEILRQHPKLRRFATGNASLVKVVKILGRKTTLVSTGS